MPGQDEDEQLEGVHTEDGDTSAEVLMAVDPAVKCDTEMFECVKCGVKYGSSGGLKYHLVTQHETNNLKVSGAWVWWGVVKSCLGVPGFLTSLPPIPPPIIL